MMDLFEKLADARIREAIERGELDDLPGKGQPLELEDLSRVPADLRMGYMILRRANVVPEEIALRKEIVSLETLIACCEDDTERPGIRKRLNDRILRYRMIIERRLRGRVAARYGKQLRKRLGA